VGRRARWKQVQNAAQLGGLVEIVPFLAVNSAR